MPAAITPVVMPKLGLSMTEGAVVVWHVEAGAEVQPGDLIADIETSKITNELEIHVGGIFQRTTVELGVEVPVGTLIAVISENAASAAEIDNFIAGYVAEEPGEADVIASDMSIPKGPPTTPDASGSAAFTSAAVPASLAGSYATDAVLASHHAHRIAQQLGIDLGRVTGTGRAGRVSKHDVLQALAVAGGSAPPSTAGGEPGAKIKTTPIAMRLANQSDVDLTKVTATGSRGRITKGDVLRHLDQYQAVAMPSPASDAANPFDEHTLNSTRKFIARRLSASKLSAPHYRLSVDVIIDKLLELRSDIEQGRNGTRVSVNDMLVRAAALALVDHPEINIQFDGDTVRRFRHADIAVAVALDDGLVTPIVRRADLLDLAEISKSLGDLVARARDGRLMPDDFEGGTFTLSNLGMFGVKSFDAIINPPQAAIMAVGRAERRLYVGEEDSGKVATFMTVTMSCDHRVIDGAMGARFLQTFKDILHHPGRLLL